MFISFSSPLLNSKYNFSTTDPKNKHHSSQMQSLKGFSYFSLKQMAEGCNGNPEFAPSFLFLPSWKKPKLASTM